MEDQEFEHPSYGMVSLHRIQSTGTVLFGSSVEHNHFVNLSITRASLNRHLHREWYHPRETLIEVNLSAVQLAEMLTNINTSGVPCTISRCIEGDLVSVPEPDNVSRQEQYVEEFKERTGRVAKLLDEALGQANAMAEMPRATKGDRLRMVKLMESVQQEIKSNLPFLLQSFNEKVEEVVRDAKGEIKAHVDQVVQAAGLEAGSVQPPAALGAD
jgi:hypothetical protein